MLLPDPLPRARGVFCNRTLNLRAIKAIGYDMDYTLIHYHVDVWEGRAYEHARGRLAQLGWPVGDLAFDPALVSRALIIDRQLGNVVKADRFGYVKAAMHGTRMLEFPELREVYGRVVVDLRDASRWEFLNTLFSLSVGCLYAQCVELLDAGRLPHGIGYPELFSAVQRALDLTHIEGELKAEIIQDPERFVDRDPDLIVALQDQRDAGKKLLLITNSEWSYTDPMMRWYFGDGWRALFDMVIVQARKPDFFLGTGPMYEIVNAEGHLLPIGPGRRIVTSQPGEPGGLYYGGHAGQVEQALGIQGQDILYVGDHIFADVHASKRTVRWRTALVLREIEDDIAANDASADEEARLGALMRDKTALERRLALLRLDLMRRRHGRPAVVDGPQSEVEADIERLKTDLATLDGVISPLAEGVGRSPHPRWGAIMRAGIDKSHMARQIERYADVYTSRVSNFLGATPSAYFRSPKSSLPHDA